MLSLCDCSKCINDLCSKRFTCLRYMGEPEYHQSYAMYNFALIDKIHVAVDDICYDHIEIKETDVLEEDKILERDNNG